jgi:hypothetical protein
VGQPFLIFGYNLVVRRAGTFVLGFGMGVTMTLLFLRLRQVISDDESYDEITSRISGHLEELERRTSANDEALQTG